MKDDKLYLHNIYECIEKIERYTRAGEDVFRNDEKTQDAVLRNFEVIGEAAKRVSEPLRAKHSDVPWRQVSGLRDILIHQYEGVDLDEVWGIVKKDLPSIKVKIRKLLDS